MRQFKIIDTHAHVFPEKVVDAAIQTLTAPGRANKLGGTLEDLFENMQRFGIAQAWTIPVATRPEQVASINTFAAAQPHESIVPFGAIHPDCEDPGAILAGFRDLGLAGFKMHPDYQNVRPTDPRMQAIFDAAVNFDLIAYFHAGDDVGPRTRFGSPTEFATIIDTYPDLHIVLAHMGGWCMWDEVEELLVGRGKPGKLYFDTAYIRGFLQTEQMLRIMREHGMDYILFGSDSPWTSVQKDIDYFCALDLSNDELEAFFHGNAERLLQAVNYQR